MNSNSNGEQFKSSVSLEDYPVRLVDVAKIFHEKGALSYDQVINNCLHKGYVGELPIYLNPEGCYCNETSLSEENIPIKVCYVKEESKKTISIDVNKNNKFICESINPQRISVSIEDLLKNRPKAKALDIDQLVSIDFDDYSIIDLKPNSGSKYQADVILENRGLGSFYDFGIKIYVSSKVDRRCYLKPLNDYFVLSERKNYKTNYLGIYRLEEFAKDTIFYIETYALYSASFERISIHAINDIWRNKLNDFVQLSGHFLLCDEADRRRCLGQYFSFGNEHSSYDYSVFSSYGDVKASIENLFILNKHKKLLLNEIDDQECKINVQHFDNIMNESHKNFPSDLKIAIEAWQDIFGNGDDHTRGSLSLLKSWIQNHPKYANLTEAKKKIIATIITPKNRKQGGAKKTV